MNARIIATAGAIAMLLTGSVIPASAQVSSADRTFAVEAAGSGKAEVADGRLALSKSSNPSVRAVAQRMIRDHSAANARLAAVASRENIMLPPGPDPADRAIMAAQRPLTGMAFDMRYLRDQRAAHVQAIALFRREIARGSDPRIVAFARSTLPILQMHLRMVEAALSRM